MAEETVKIPGQIAIDAYEDMRQFAQELSAQSTRDALEVQRLRKALDDRTEQLERAWATIGALEAEIKELLP